MRSLPSDVCSSAPSLVSSEHLMRAHQVWEGVVKCGAQNQCLGDPTCASLSKNTAAHPIRIFLPTKQTISHLCLASLSRRSWKSMWNALLSMVKQPLLSPCQQKTKFCWRVTRLLWHNFSSVNQRGLLMLYCNGLNESSHGGNHLTVFRVLKSS